MPLKARIETAISAATAIGQGRRAPPRLASALEYATAPGGARIRPTILMSVAMACGDDRPALSDAAAAALELIHCASLVHDDMPCFDDANIRRGKASVHCAYSEPLALLTGDSLIVLAFEVLARELSRGSGTRGAADSHTGTADRHAGRYLCRPGLGKRNQG